MYLSLQAYFSHCPGLGRGRVELVPSLGIWVMRQLMAAARNGKTSDLWAFDRHLDKCP